jgi:hypothetical protein
MTSMVVLPVGRASAQPANSAQVAIIPPPGGEGAFNDYIYNYTCAAVLTGGTVGRPATGKYQLTLAGTISPVNVIAVVSANIKHYFDHVTCSLESGSGGATATAATLGLAATGSATASFSEQKAQVRVCIEAGYFTQFDDEMPYYNSISHCGPLP